MSSLTFSLHKGIQIFYALTNILSQAKHNVSKLDPLQTNSSKCILERKTYLQKMKHNMRKNNIQND
jgi:hypothetical protein